MTHYEYLKPLLCEAIFNDIKNENHMLFVHGQAPNWVDRINDEKRNTSTYPKFHHSITKCMHWRITKRGHTFWELLSRLKPHYDEII